MMADFRNTKSLKVNGTRLACIEQGRGDPVVLVHGGVSDVRTWDNQISVLAQEFRVVAYSRRYARPNAEIPEGGDDPIQQHVDDLFALIALKGLGRVDLVGHSLGGLIALMLALQQPALVRSLVLIEPPVMTMFGRMPPGPLRFLILLLTRPRTAVALARFGSAVMRPAARAFRAGEDRLAIEILGKAVLGRTYFNTLSRARYQQVWENRNSDKAQLQGQGLPPLDPAKIAELTQPVLLLQGSDSPVLFHRLNARLQVLIPKARITEIAHASHILHEDKPSSVNAEIMKFLARAGR